MKTYDKILKDTLAEEKLGKDRDNGWINLKSIKNDPNIFFENVKTLKDLSIENGWCTGSGQADPYLRLGDFWLYMKNKHAVVAVRFIGGKNI